MLPTWTIDLGDLLDNYQPVYCDDWPTQIEMMLEDPDDRAIILILADELVARGQFDKPVRLEEAEAGGDRPSPARVGDGTHRVCAHVLTAHTVVSVTDRLEDSDGCWRLEWELLSELSEDVHERLLSVSSFRLAPACWVNCNVQCSDGRQFTAFVSGAESDSGPAVLAAYTERYVAVGAPLGHGTAHWDAANIDQ